MTYGVHEQTKPDEAPYKLEAVMKVDIYMDHVMIAGQRLERPPSVSRSKWMGLWEKHIKGGYIG